MFTLGAYSPTGIGPMPEVDEAISEVDEAIPEVDEVIPEVDVAIPEVDEAYCGQPLESHPSSCRRVNPPSLRVAS